MVKVSKREVMKEAMEHPTLVKRFGIGIAVQIAKDHAKKPKTTTKEGKREYQKQYMRLRRGQPFQMPRMSKKDFGTVYDALFMNDKSKPLVKFKDPDRW